MTQEHLVRLVARIRAAATLYECDVLSDEWIVSPPCEDLELEALKAHFGNNVPQSLLLFFTRTSAHVEFCWYLMGDLPEPFSGINCGELALSPQLVVAADQGRALWTRKVFSDPSNPYDKLWHTCRGLMHLPSGDCIGWDEFERIVYLSHDGMDTQHGYVLANSFDDFIHDYLLLGAPAPEFGWSIFTENSESGISATSETARLWIDIFFADETAD